ncbi:tRNA (adenosine(37)-N6)-dimethylallyltransferase MiaA [Glaciecola sp. 1036]|uniref:tRNA (adenosine(37)-N6)-dimethylallyltransferase MiaA n=1 Tax=Alteromonadaceae TaxID=72275 RepID=UPI003D0393E0
MTDPLPNAICIMGPTASGKTDLAIELAQHINGEVISVDSALVFQDMNIGTAKPTMDERQGIPHWLIDILSPEQSYSVSDFIIDAESKIREILVKGKIPILAGGTMMYFNGLINGISQIPASDAVTREKVKSLIEEQGLESVHAQLAQIDPEAAQRLHPNDTQRVSRAMEVYLATGHSLTHWQQQKATPSEFNFTQFAIMPTDRSLLHQAIERRFDLMLEKGFIDEVKFLLEKYQLHEDLPALRSVGYRQIFEYLKGKTTFNEMRELGIIATRQLAKRQITWLRGWENLTNLETGDIKNLSIVLKKVGT